VKNNPFRRTALDARQVQWLGRIVLLRPISFTFLTIFAGSTAFLVIIFFIFGSYTSHATVNGQLVPDTGLIKIYAPQPGIILQKHVMEGQSVKEGELLYVISSERQSSTQGNTQAAISNQVESRRQSLRDEIEKTIAIQKEERNALVKKNEGFQLELLKLDNQIEGQSSRVTLAENTVARYKELLVQDYISKEQLQQKQEDLLDQRNRLQGLQRDHINVARDLDASKNDLFSLPFKQQNQLAQLDRNLVSAGQELTESEAKRGLMVTAPGHGFATAVAAELGQAVDTTKPLVSVVPAGAKLLANLYAPSRTIGFIKPGDTVLLRYQAYPYQKFGHAYGTVVSVSRTAVPGKELSDAANLPISGMAVSNEPLYCITVSLAKQFINAYGKQQALQAGMLLEADVMLDTRRLYEWVLEPLYSLSGKI
jgi:membrane fusion protein